MAGAAGRRRPRDRFCAACGAALASPHESGVAVLLAKHLVLATGAYAIAVFNIGLAGNPDGPKYTEGQLETAFVAATAVGVGTAVTGAVLLVIPRTRTWLRRKLWLPAVSVWLSTLFGFVVALSAAR